MGHKPQVMTRSMRSKGTRPVVFLCPSRTGGSTVDPSHGVRISVANICILYTILIVHVHYLESILECPKFRTCIVYELSTGRYNDKVTSISKLAAWKAAPLGCNNSSSWQKHVDRRHSIHSCVPLAQDMAEIIHFRKGAAPLEANGPRPSP